ncbi:MAG: T9SS type A sorting domain-containing protein [Gelidibacter sp.]
MKTKLLILSFFFISATLMSQVVANQVDDFENGTTQSWYTGTGSTPTNISTDGPSGTDDNYLRNVATGTSGPSGRMVVNNVAQWGGDYPGEGIVGIKLDVRALGTDLNVRVAFNGAGGTICSSSAAVVNDGTGWQTVVIPIDVTDMTLVSGANCCPPGTDAAATLASVSEMRILSSAAADYRGDIIAGEMHIDNITAVTTLTINEQSLSNEFKIIQNPSRSKLMLSLPNSQSKLEVFDVLGKKIITKQLSGLTSTIDVSKWNNGVYLVRVTSDAGTQTKRFVKQ